MITIYSYAKCGTCRKALAYLRERNIPFREKAICETPPSRDQLETMLGYYGGEVRRLFNTSGQDYRTLGLKDKLPALSNDQAFELLESNGKLVKRPFLLGEGFGFVGFRENEWERLTK